MELSFILLAFTAGMIAFFSPCCVALLPAYIGHSLREGRVDPGASVASVGRRGVAAVVALAAALPLTQGGYPLVRLGLAALGLGSGPSFGPGELSEIQAALSILAGFGLVVVAVAIARAPSVLVRALGMGSAATAGFLVVFLAIGLPVAFLARFLVPYLAYAAVAVGLVLVAAGALMLAGRAMSWSVRFRVPRPAGARGYFVFGLGYGVASMSCTFPVFLSVIAGALFSGGMPEALAVFAAYALGKGTLLTGIAVAAAGGATGRTQALVQKVLPRMEVVSAALLVLGGGYVAWYFGRALLG